MSTKRFLDKQNELETKNCGCTISFNDGIREYCEKHLSEQEAEAEYWSGLSEANDSVFEG